MMSDTAAAWAVRVGAWLQPLSGADAPCGANLEDDVDFVSMNQAAIGKPEPHFGPPIPPDWPAARAKAEQLMQRTRDLRVAIVWIRAALSTDGIAALAPGLQLVHGLVAQHWERLHPMPDADAPTDYYARVNALRSLAHANALLGDLRHTKVIAHRAVGELTVSSVELAFGSISPRSDEVKPAREQLQQMFAAALEAMPSLRSQIDEARNALADLDAAVAVKVRGHGGAGALSAELPDFTPLGSVLDHLMLLLPPRAEQPRDPMPAGGAEETGVVAPSPTRTPALQSSGGFTGIVRSRADAVRAIDLACEYLDQAEPASPAPMLLRRARRMINQNFLQLMLELAPSAMPDVAKAMGVDPASVKPDSTA